ncbi:hypothetical protein NONO_c33300 [Nocardia nova SH22a]|uniref:Uncharacterized protein n=1 Tax=Nocardia nova SH22a TaxID=1415166 RepID=W5TFX4_9NOCA|nr:hypothetical protein [Nocardia nova]AHH18117.1 hypothetical protein NONO_c33300 [Nocardia nova SH22a]
MIALTIGSLAAAVGIYLVIVLWPQRVPKDRSVTEIRRRAESERRADYRGGNAHGR